MKKDIATADDYNETRNPEPHHEILTWKKLQQLIL